ncbi:MAG: B12-binding domain-containing radical SAM protein [Acidobacteriia bacterium]|nr:B12-binding domain-containing radical SAM protein [Terriglobia bacterium]
MAELRALQECEPVFPPLGKNLRVLLVWPKIPDSFWTFTGMVVLLPEKTIMPPLGLITVAALCPPDWTLRLVDQAVEELTDDDILWADLVMVSAMTVQEAGLREVLARARRLGRRTMVGGPYASGEPTRMLPIADHVVVGEPDEVFSRIALDLEEGTAKRLYEIADKPDVTQTPLPRFELLKLDCYASMSIQFSRGCPFQCEFCDIIILYGRKPRTKQPEQMLAELDRLLSLGWRKQVFIVDDNFIGNHARALELCGALEKWQQARGHPVMFYTEASMDLARKPALVEAMVKANFFYVFLGIESPSKESLKEVKKLQNLAMDPVSCIDLLQKKGLWVTGGFIVGFDSDTEDIFEQQIQFIERTAIPWALLNFLHALPRTALYDRMHKEGRMLQSRGSSSDGTAPNFRTTMHLEVLLRGFRKTVCAVYDAEKFYARAWRSLENWKTRKSQHPAQQPTAGAILGILARSIWHQGLRSSYRRAYWRFFLKIFGRYSLDRPKIWLAVTMLISGQHFIPYARQVAEKVEGELLRVETELEPAAAPAGD